MPGVQALPDDLVADFWSCYHRSYVERDARLLGEIQDCPSLGTFCKGATIGMPGLTRGKYHNPKPGPKVLPCFHLADLGNLSPDDLTSTGQAIHLPTGLRCISCNPICGGARTMKEKAGLQCFRQVVILLAPGFLRVWHFISIKRVRCMPMIPDPLI